MGERAKGCEQETEVVGQIFRRESEREERERIE